MNSIVYKVWCEYDIGLENIVFTKKIIAEEYVENQWEEDELGSLEEAYDTGLVYIEEVHIIGEVK